MKRILVAYDGSECASHAIEDLGNAGLPPQAQARVLSVADVWLPPDPNPVEKAPPDYVPQSQIQNREEAIAIYQESRRMAEAGAAMVRAKFPDWEVQPIWKADSPGWAVLQESTRWPADLIVVGAHSHSTLHRFFLGSVSQKVVADAHCSVRVARPHPHRGGHELRIVIAVDGSSDSELAVAEGAGRTWPAGTKFQLVTVLDAKLKSYRANAEPWAKPGDPSEEWVGRMTGSMAERLRSKGLDTEVQIFEGDPKKRLLDHADSWKADCIFLGARGLNHGNRLYLGTFASAVAGRAHCSVEIVRKG